MCLGVLGISGYWITGDDLDEGNNFKTSLTQENNQLGVTKIVPCKWYLWNCHDSFAPLILVNARQINKDYFVLSG